MPRTRRIVLPGVPHHVIQRGNRQQAIFHNDGDRRAYLALLKDALERHETRCLAWCLMSNHVHLVLQPATEDGLRAPLASAHTAYAQRLNRRESASGHLFQGRFASYAMDDAHLMVAVRYVENNPVKAGLVPFAGDWRWSSAAAHLGKPDGLTDVAAIGRHVRHWEAYLRDGLEAADRDDAVESALRSGRPLASDAWKQAHGFAPPKPRGRPQPAAVK